MKNVGWYVVLLGMVGLMVIYQSICYGVENGNVVYPVIMVVFISTMVAAIGFTIKDIKPEGDIAADEIKEE